jgi:predicted aldo/keto reductase-like oxidoreductase
MEMPRRVLGPTGLEVTIIGVGGFHMAKPGEKAGIKIIRTAIDEGVNFLDNAWCYHGGRAEEIMGKALRDGYRERVVLMTKNHGRDYDTYVAQLSQSLARLQTDYIDLVQFHEIIHEGEPARIFNEGAIDAAVEARKDGKIGHIGFTGHRSPGLLQEMLSGDFDWEAVQMPVNLLDHHYRSFQQQIMPAKAAVTTPEENIRYSLSRPIATLVSGMDSLDVLRKNLQTAREFEPLSEAETEQLLDVTKDASQAGRFENYKTRDD